MNELKVFENEEFGKVRTTTVNGEPFFVGKDVAEILGYSNSRKALIDHVDDEDKADGVTIRDSIGREQSPVLINESGIYSLILSSKLQNARKFKRWITSEVLPSIRKNGGYLAGQEQMSPEQIIANALVYAHKILDEKDKKIQEMKPKAEFFDAVADSKTAIPMKEVAAVLAVKGFGRNNLFEFLREKRILDKNNTPNRRYIDMSWFRTVEQKYTKPDGEVCINIKTLVYQKGIDGIRKLIEENR